MLFSCCAWAGNDDTTFKGGVVSSTLLVNKHAGQRSLRSMDQDAQTQRRLLARRNCRLHQSLQVDLLFPYLNEQALLSDHEADILLNQYHTRRYKIGRLLEWIPRNGRDGLDRFIVCLRRSSREAPGHGELADMLEHDRNSPNPDTGLRIQCSRQRTGSQYKCVQNLLPARAAFFANE